MTGLEAAGQVMAEQKGQDPGGEIVVGHKVGSRGDGIADVPRPVPGATRLDMG